VNCYFIRYVFAISGPLLKLHPIYLRYMHLEQAIGFDLPEHHPTPSVDS
jgi:hypothetical protein